MATGSHGGGGGWGYAAILSGHPASGSRWDPPRDLSLDLRLDLEPLRRVDLSDGAIIPWGMGTLFWVGTILRDLGLGWGWGVLWAARGLEALAPERDHLMAMGVGQGGWW